MISPESYKTGERMDELPKKIKSDTQFKNLTGPLFAAQFFYLPNPRYHLGYHVRGMTLIPSRS
jgi:hypothetical protein